MTRRSRSGLSLPQALSVACISFAYFGVCGTYGFSLWDEGFLWYGAQRILAGEVPFRDFQSYDPARHYWVAGVMALVRSNGIMAMRAANAILQAITLLLIVRLVVRARPHGPLGAAALGATFFLWMYPDYKVADYLASTLLLWGIAQLIEQPVAPRYVWAGVAVGLAAVIGRNHGLYGVLGLALTIGFLRRHGRGIALRRAAAAIGTGFLVGSLPTLLAVLLVDGYFDALWRYVVFIFRFGSTNLSRAWASPWTVRFHSISAYEGLRRVFIGSLFLVPPMFAALGLALAWSRRAQARLNPNPVFLAAVVLSLPYAHYTWSRPDLVHLALGIYPLLVGVLTMPWLASRRVGGIVTLLVFLGSLFAMAPAWPGRKRVIPSNWRAIDVGGSSLTVSPPVAEEVTLLRQLVRRHAQGRPVLVAPFWPGAYAVLEQQAPTREIYYLFPRDERFERAEIQRLKSHRPALVLVVERLLDGLDERRYSHTHPLTYAFIKACYDEVDSNAGGLNVRVFVEADRSGAPMAEECR